MNIIYKLLINILIKFPKNRITIKIIYILLDHLKDGPIKTKQGFLINFKSTGFHSTALRKSVIIGTYESLYLAMIKKLINLGDYVIDVGSHEGYITLFISQLVGQNGRVFSIEPNDENLKFLRKNIDLNKIRNIEVIGKAISNKKSRMLFRYDDDMGAWGSLIHFSHL